MTQKEFKSFLDRNIPLKDVIKYLGITITIVWTAHTYYTYFTTSIDNKFVVVNSRIDSLLIEIRNMPKCRCEPQDKEAYYGLAGIQNTKLK